MRTGNFLGRDRPLGCPRVSALTAFEIEVRRVDAGGLVWGQDVTEIVGEPLALDFAEKLKKQFRIQRDGARAGKWPEIKVCKRLAEHFVKRVRIQRDKPRTAILAMRHNPWLAAGIAFGLGAGLGQIELLNALNFDMQPVERDAHHVRAVGATGKLLPAPRVKTVCPQQLSKFAFANLAFVTAVQRAPP